MQAVEPGAAVVSLVTPHAGQARAFHRWYERDHFHAGCMAGPGFFAGRRFVSTGEGPLRFLTLYWIAADADDDAVRWSIERFHALREQGRIFAAADLELGGFYAFAETVRRDPDGVPPALALDHPFSGVILTLIDCDDPSALRDALARHATRGAVALSVGLAPRPRPAGAVRAAAPDDEPGRWAWLHFVEGETEAALASGVAGLERCLGEAGCGDVASPATFRPTVPGTDAFVDDR